MGFAEMLQFREGWAEIKQGARVWNPVYLAAIGTSRYDITLYLLDIITTGNGCLSV